MRTIAKSRNASDKFENLESAAKLHCMLSMQLHVVVVSFRLTYVWVQVRVPGLSAPQCSSQHMYIS